jgi:hypothetical protein
MSNPYNGYSWDERMAKFKEMQRRFSPEELKNLNGPCRLCGDPGGPGTDVTFEYHDEDYSREYSWLEPAAFIVCRNCHIYRIHQRFAHPIAWRVFLAHVERGGYARDMRTPQVQHELKTYRDALKSGTALPQLKALNGGGRSIKGEWFSELTLDPASIDDKAYRPRA